MIRRSILSVVRSAASWHTVDVVAVIAIAVAVVAIVVAVVDAGLPLPQHLLFFQQHGVERNAGAPLRIFHVAVVDLQVVACLQAKSSRDSCRLGVVDGEGGRLHGSGLAWILVA